MQQLAWGDTLCGVEVTPESWIGGVVERPSGTWGIVVDIADCGAHGLTFQFDDIGALPGCESCKPIFPPRGWAGKTDAALCAAVFGRWPIQIGNVTLYPKGWPSDGWWFSTNGDALPIHEATPLQQAIGNALTIRARLTEARDG